MDGIQSLISNIGNCKLLTKEEEIELSKLIEQGNQAARDKMIRANIRLAINLAKKHNKTSGSDLEDLIQESSIGLIKAVDRFDWRKGYKFSTYACWWIKQSLRSYVASQSGSIRLPNHARNTLWKMKEIIQNYKKEFGIEPTNEEIADLLGTTTETLHSIIQCATQAVSIDDSGSNSEDGSSKRNLSETIAFQEEESIDDIIDRKKMMAVIKEAFSELSSREEMVLRMRFGLAENF